MSLFADLASLVVADFMRFPHSEFGVLFKISNAKSLAQRRGKHEMCGRSKMAHIVPGRGSTCRRLLPAQSGMVQNSNNQDVWSSLVFADRHPTASHPR